MHIVLCTIFVLTEARYLAAAPAKKTMLAVDQFFNAVSIGPARISPGGQSVAIKTTCAGVQC